MSHIKTIVAFTLLFLLACHVTVLAGQEYAYVLFDNSKVAKFKIDPKGKTAGPECTTKYIGDFGSLNMTTDPLGHFLYAVGNGDGIICCSKIAANGNIRALKSCKLPKEFYEFDAAVDRSGRYLYVTGSYDEKHIVCQYRIQKNGELKPMKPVMAAGRDNGYFIAVHPKKPFVYVVSTEAATHISDSYIMQYKQNSNGTLSPLKESSVYVPGSCGRIVFDKDGAYAYSSDVERKIIHQYKVGSDGCLKLIDTIEYGGYDNSMEGFDFYGAELSISPNGKALILTDSYLTGLFVLKISDDHKVTFDNAYLTRNDVLVTYTEVMKQAKENVKKFNPNPSDKDINAEYYKLRESFGTITMVTAAPDGHIYGLGSSSIIRFDVTGDGTIKPLEPACMLPANWWAVHSYEIIDGTGIRISVRSFKVVERK